MASVHPQITARHETACITDQEHCRAPVFLRCAELAQHILRRPVPSPVRELLEERLDHGRDDVAGRYGVDADAVLAPLGGEVAGELDDARFGGVVGGADEALRWRR